MVEGELQPWTRLQGSTATTWIYQPAAEVLDVSGYQDATFTIDVRDFSNDVRIYIQTATVVEEEAFLDLVNYRPTAAGRKLYKIETLVKTPDVAWTYVH